MVHLIKLHDIRDNKEVLINPINITYIQYNEYNRHQTIPCSRIMFNAVGYNNHPQSLDVEESLDEILSIIKRS
jgi:hypothetical protein